MTYEILCHTEALAEVSIFIEFTKDSSVFSRPQNDGNKFWSTKVDPTVAITVRFLLFYAEKFMVSFLT